MHSVEPPTNAFTPPATTTGAALLRPTPNCFASGMGDHAAPSGVGDGKWRKAVR